MRSPVMSSSSLLSALALCAATLSPLGAVAAELAPETTQAAGVSVSVKPADVSPGAAAWVFEVALNTHGGSLDDDLSHTVALVDAAGKPHAPIAWEGDPAGGHHRHGVLKFAALAPRPQALEVRMQRPGEPAPRTFRWTLQ